MRNVLAHVSRGQHTVVAAAIRESFDQPDPTQAGKIWHKVAEQLRPRWPKLADLMDASEHDVLAYMSFPRQQRTKLHSTNPIERLNKEVKRRADVVGIIPNEASIMRLIGAVLFEQNDEWQTASRYMMVEAFAQIDTEEVDPILRITTKAASSCPQAIWAITPLDGRDQWDDEGLAIRPLIPWFQTIHHQIPLVTMDAGPYTDRRRRGRVVEGTPLLRVQAGNRLEGSNPFVSATCTLQTRKQVPRGAFFFMCQRGLQGPYALQRRPSRARSVSERPPSLSTRPSPPARRVQNPHRFQ